jgi:putative N6-adenine-specific DNA methylase
MTAQGDFEIFLVAAPGLEAALADEARGLGFAAIKVMTGGVRIRGGWPAVWRANLMLRGAGRVLARIGSFRAVHLAQLDKRARQFPWADFLRKDVAVAVEAACTRSKIYHSGAAAERIGRAIHEELGATIADEAPVVVKARIADDLCTISLDTSGGLLHKRGHKAAVAKAPLRETLAALLLAQCGYDGHEPVYDPMCGSGSFVIEAAEMALGLAPGRDRAFAFEQLTTFDEAQWMALKAAVTPQPTAFTFYGSDRDQGAVTMAAANAARAGVGAVTRFHRAAISDVKRPEGPAGLVIINPPYGDRIGDKARLAALYGALGRVLRERFSGWRVGLVTNEAALARATGLALLPPSPPISHGGLKVRLYQTGPLP